MKFLVKNKKGVFSFLYLFAIFTYLLSVLSIYLMIYERTSYLENKIFILEERAGRELELKHAVKRVIIYSEQIRIMESFLKTLFPEYSLVFDSSYSLYGVNRLNDLTSDGSHSYYHWRGYALKFWCGFPSENEIVDMITIKGRKPEYFGSNQIYQRLNVFNVDDTVIIGNEVKNICSLFLSTSINQSTTITKPAKKIMQGISEDILENTIYDLINVKYGVMAYDSKENISSAIIIPESTEIFWDDYLGLQKVVR